MRTSGRTRRRSSSLTETGTPSWSSDDARRFVDALRGVSAQPVVYAELPGAHHTFDVFHSIRFESVISGIEAFAAWVRSARI